MDGNESFKDELHEALMFFHSSMPTAETCACLSLSSCDMTCEQPPWPEVGAYETAEDRFVHGLFKASTSFFHLTLNQLPIIQ